MSANNKKLFKRAGAAPEHDFWYMYLRDPSTGKLIRKSTYTFDEKEALEIWQREKEKLDALSTNAKLDTILSLYTKPETNPRYKSAKLEGGHYGMEHAKQVARECRNMHALFSRNCPAIMKMKISDIKTMQFKILKQTLIKEYGNRRVTALMFMTLKSVFSQAHEDGITEINVTTGISNIHYKANVRAAVDEKLIGEIIALKDSFAYIVDWAFFTVLATTGMRRSEVLALSSEQIKDGVLTLDRALKSMGKDDIGLPKWDIVRVIPLSKITQYALSCITPDKDGRYFHYNRYWADESFRRIRCTAVAALQESSETIMKITPHVLRHSLNTNLLAAEVSPVLTAYYLAWEHQTLIDMQERYTHLQAMKLSAVSSGIDAMFPMKDLFEKEKLG